MIWTSQGIPAAAQSADEGEDIFKAKCAACHTIGGGALVGPDLEGVTTRRPPDWLPRWIAEPDVMLAEGDPIAAQLLVESNNIPMPNLGLTDAEVASLIAFLETQTGVEPVTTTAPVAQPPVTTIAPAAQPPVTTTAPVAQPPVVTTAPSGDVATGKRIFEGTKRLENGGPPCLACHSIGGIGELGGGVLGPDLTQAFGTYGADGLAAVLGNIPFPTMRPIFGEGERPLTPEEQAHLVAFLQQAPLSGRTSGALTQLVLLAGVGAVLLLLLTRVVWRKRLTEVRRPMVARSHARIERSKLTRREHQRKSSKVERR